MGKIKDRTNEERINKQGLIMKIIRYGGAKDIDVEFKDGTIIKNREYGDFKKGTIKNLCHPEVFDFGFISEGKYDSRVHGEITIEYQRWIDMIRRCYDAYYINEKLTYKDVTICEEWSNFQVFAEWYNENKWSDELLLSPDKDILCHNQSKVYSPETCLLVDQRINKLFTKCDKVRGLYPVGVFYEKDSKKFISQIGIDKKHKHLGRFNTPEEAFFAYKSFKENCIKEVAWEYFNKYPNFPYKLLQAMYEYKVLIND